MQKTMSEVWDPERLVILALKSLFCTQKPQMRAGTHRDYAIHVVLFAQNDRWSMGPMKTSNSAANHAVLSSQNDRWGLGPKETCISGPKVAVLHVKATNEGRNPYTLVILMLKSLFCMPKTIGEVWDP